MAHRIKSILFMLAFSAGGIVSLYNLARAVQFGELMVRHRSGWTRFAEAPFAFTIALMAYSIMALAWIGALVYMPHAKRQEYIALQRWKNSPRFDDPTHRFQSDQPNGENGR